MATIPGDRSTVKELQAFLGVTADGAFGPLSKAALMRRLSNLKAPAITEADFQSAAVDLGVERFVPPAVRKVEAPRGAFDDKGRPSILYEPHIFGRETDHRFAAKPHLSARQWRPGCYGPLSIQYEKLGEACALDPGGAFKACSWGAFQVLGANAVSIGYSSALAMALDLTESEGAHLVSFVRFVKGNSLVDALRACRPGDPESCIPFVRRYNGPAFRKNNYHVKFAAALKAERDR